MAGRSAEKIQLSNFDDLFGTNETLAGQDVCDMQVKEIPLAELHKFKDHPFKKQTDEKLAELSDSVAKHGVIVPGICRLRPQGGYEILAGHTRKLACEMAGLATMPMVIRNLDDDEATIVMVDSNIQRETLLPSERARAYKMRYEALKHQGSKNGGSSLVQMSADTGDSEKKIQRYIWLARLTDELLEFVDTKRLGFSQGVDISFLPEEEQMWVYEAMAGMEVSISTAQSREIKELSQHGQLNRTVLWKLLSKEEKSKARKVVIKADRLNDYFADNYSEEEITDIIIGLLDEWKKRGEGDA